MNKYGFKKDQITDDHYLKGKIERSIVNVSGNWSTHLPENEYQMINAIETFNCTAFGTLNALEILARYVYALKVNYSDRFLGILAGTEQGGNSPHKVAETLRGNGTIPEELLPFDAIDTKEYYSFPDKSIEAQCIYQGKKWLRYWLFKHEWVYGDNVSLETKQQALLDALKYSPVGISVDAWKSREGLYYKDRDDEDNHWCVLINGVKDKYWEVFDSYDGFVKKLEWNYNFEQAKSYYLELRQEPLPQISPIQAVLDKLWDLLEAIKQYVRATK